jgi:hypothetical protein
VSSMLIQSALLWNRQRSQAYTGGLFNGQAFGEPTMGGHALPSPGLKDAPVLDLMCSHFVLTLAAPSRVASSMCAATSTACCGPWRAATWCGPHPSCNACANSWGGAARTTNSGAATKLWATARFLDATVPGAALRRRHAVLLHRRIRQGRAQGPAGRAGRTGDWLTHALKKQSTLVEKNIDALAGLLQLNPAERALLLYGTLARYQRDLRGMLVEFKVNNAPEAYAAMAAWPASTPPRWPRRCAPARAWSASAWSRT